MDWVKVVIVLIGLVVWVITHIASQQKEQQQRRPPRQMPPRPQEDGRPDDLRSEDARVEESRIDEAVNRGPRETLGRALMG